MELTYRRTQGDEITEGYLRNFSADFEITTDADNPTNDFEIVMPLPDTADDLLYIENSVSTIIYVDGTEWGGLIMGSEIDLKNSTVTYTGRTWRGLLSLYIIEPPSGSDYLTVTSGTNIATALEDLPMHSLISIQETSYTASAFQYNRYITTHEGATNMLINAQEDLRMKFAYDESTGYVLLTVEPASDRTDLIEISQDYDDHVKLIITQDGETPKHVICLGSGELAEREVIHLYADEDWNVSATAISGAYPVDIYDYSGSDNLTTDGEKHFAQLIADHQQIEVTIDGLDVELSDIIAAREILTGEYVTAEITSIIYKCTDYGTYQTESFEYKTNIKTHSKREVIA